MEDMFDTKKQFETWPETMSKSKTGDKQVKGDKTLKVFFPHHNIFFFFQNPTNHYGHFCLYILSSNTSRVYRSMPENILFEVIMNLFSNVRTIKVAMPWIPWCLKEGFSI